jgi:hypothetical protein
MLAIFSQRTATKCVHQGKKWRSCQRVCRLRRVTLEICTLRASVQIRELRYLKCTETNLLEYCNMKSDIWLTEKKKSRKGGQEAAIFKIKVVDSLSRHLEQERTAVFCSEAVQYISKRRGAEKSRYGNSIYQNLLSSFRLISFSMCDIQES